MKNIIFRLIYSEKDKYLIGVLLQLFLFLSIGVLVFIPNRFKLDETTYRFVYWSLLFIGMTSLVFFNIWLYKLIDSYMNAGVQIRNYHAQFVQIEEQKELIINLSQKFAEANCEEEVIIQILDISLDYIKAEGVSYVPLDDDGKPLTAFSKGNLPFPVVNDWVEYLASPFVRERCETCKQKNSITTSCPLLEGPISDAIGMYCFPFRRGDREFGVLNLYLPSLEDFTEQKRDFLKLLVDETALALEGIRLRAKEIEIYNQLQLIQLRTNQSSLLKNIISRAYQSLDANYAVFFTRQKEGEEPEEKIVFGDIPEPDLENIISKIKNIMNTGNPINLKLSPNNQTPISKEHWILGVPCIPDNTQFAGVILVGRYHPVEFNKRQENLIQVLASFVTQIAQNDELLAGIEYQTIMTERARLAREIHDGLAQTLGFLKLQVAQMRNFLDRGDFDKLGKFLEISYSTLSDAYQDARVAIDGLRIWPDKLGMNGWLKQTAQDFHDISGLVTHLDECSKDIDFPPEIQAQVIRIIQEALSNVRKHAGASEVYISCDVKNDDYWLEVKDDGVGFQPEDISGPSQHGLRGMRERADLIGADFQIISRPQEGTLVRLRFPFNSFVRREEFV